MVSNTFLVSTCRLHCGRWLLACWFCFIKSWLTIAWLDYCSSQATEESHDLPQREGVQMRDMWEDVLHSAAVKTSSTRA